MTTYLITGTPPIDDFKPFTVPQGTFLAILAFLANELTVAVPLGTEEPKQPHETIISGNSLFCGLSVIIYRPYVPWFLDRIMKRFEKSQYQLPSGGTEWKLYGTIGPPVQEDLRFPDGKGCYIILNIQTGKCYVGYTDNNFKARMSDHFRQKGSNANLADAIQRDGTSSFAYKVWVKPGKDPRGSLSFATELEESICKGLKKAKAAYNIVVSPLPEEPISYSILSPCRTVWKKTHLAEREVTEAILGHTRHRVVVKKNLFQSQIIASSKGYKNIVVLSHPNRMRIPQPAWLFYRGILSFEARFPSGLQDQT